MQGGTHVLPVIPVAPRNGILDGHAGFEFPASVSSIQAVVLNRRGDTDACIPQVQSVVDVVPESGAAQHVALALALLAGEPVGALAVLARVAVQIRIEVQDGVVGGGALELESCDSSASRGQGWELLPYQSHSSRG